MEWTFMETCNGFWKSSATSQREQLLTLLKQAEGGQQIRVKEKQGMSTITIDMVKEEMRDRTLKEIIANLQKLIGEKDPAAFAKAFQEARDAFDRLTKKYPYPYPYPTAEGKSLDQSIVGQILRAERRTTGFDQYRHRQE